MISQGGNAIKRPRYRNRTRFPRLCLGLLRRPPCPQPARFPWRYGRCPASQDARRGPRGPRWTARAFSRLRSPVAGLTADLECGPGPHFAPLALRGGQAVERLAKATPSCGFLSVGSVAWQAIPTQPPSISDPDRTLDAGQAKAQNADLPAIRCNALIFAAVARVPAGNAESRLSQRQSRTAVKRRERTPNSRLVKCALGTMNNSAFLTAVRVMSLFVRAQANIPRGWTQGGRATPERMMGSHHVSRYVRFRNHDHSYRPACARLLRPDRGQRP